MNASSRKTSLRRAQVATPALILEVEALDHNIEVMAAWAKSQSVGLRPHAKAHKSPDIARRLIAQGAVGASCATIAEAEELAAADIPGLLITSPMVTSDMLKRLRILLLRGADVSVVADDPRNIEALSDIAHAAKRKLPVLVELDVGQGRTGCGSIKDACQLAKRIAGDPYLEFSGIQAYWGFLQQLMPYEEREARIAQRIKSVVDLVTALKRQKLAPAIITGGGTGTHWIDAGFGLFTELQPGSYLFLDSCYAPLPLTPDGNPFKPALFVAASVVSAVHPGRAVIDAGFKAFACDSGKPVPARGAVPNATYRFMGDEHGAIEFDASLPPPALGSVIELLTSHCDPTVNLYRSYQVARHDSIIDEWPIVARGY